MYECKQWVVKCRTANLDNKTPEQLYKNYVVCAEHFEDRMFMNSTVRNTLVHNAVPTLFQHSVSNKPATKRKPPRERLLPTKKARMSSETAVENSSCPSMNSDNFVVDSPAVPAPSDTVTPRKSVLNCKLAYAQSCLRRARVALFRSRQAAARLSNPATCEQSSSCLCSLCVDVKALSSTQQKFFHSQVRATKVSKFGMRYTAEDKLLALGVLYKSPAAYRFMSQNFRLPSVRTLQMFVAGLHSGCGFKSDYFAALSKRVESMNSSEKFCVLTFDGMALKSKLQYSQAIDKVIGYVDCSHYIACDSCSVAKQALQFMVRGISSKWKQPVGHFFTSTTVSAETLEHMLKDVIALLEGIGLRVVAVVCDQEISHRLLYKNLGITDSKPWFLSAGNNKVFAMFDVPHLIKNLRNNLLNYNICIDGHKVSFAHLQKLYELERSSTLRLCPKLTDNHLHLKPFKKMRVKLATQLLSHSVATALRTYVNFGQMDADALHTASFVEHVDKLFDVMNSRYRAADHKWKKPLSAKTREQCDLLSNAHGWISSWKFENVVSKKEKNLPFCDGLKLTTCAIFQATEFLIKVQKFKFVLTSRFNQDIVENWFSCVRQKGLNNDSRTTWEYESASKALMVNWMLNTVSHNANCEVDFDYFIGVMANLHQSTVSTHANSNQLVHVSAATPTTSTMSVSAVTDTAAATGLDTDSSKCLRSVGDCSLDVSFDDIDTELDSAVTDWTQTFHLSSTDDAVTCYLAGYAMAKLSRHLTCSQCMSAYQTSCARSQGELYCSNSSRLAFIQYKTYDWAKHGLVSPSEQLYELCVNFEKVTQMSLEKLVYGRNVKRNLLECFATSVDFSSYMMDFSCDEHQSHVRSLLLDLLARVRIHHFVRIRNRELLQLEQSRKLKVNRKAKKVMHH